MTAWADAPAPGEEAAVPLRRPGETVPRAWLRAYDYMVGRNDGRIRPATADEARAIHERIVRAALRP